ILAQSTQIARIVRRKPGVEDGLSLAVFHPRAPGAMQPRRLGNGKSRTDLLLAGQENGLAADDIAALGQPRSPNAWSGVVTSNDSYRCVPNRAILRLEEFSPDWEVYFGRDQI